MSPSEEIKMYTPAVVLGIFGVLQCMFLYLLLTSENLTFTVNGKKTILVIEDHSGVFLVAKIALIALAALFFYLAFRRIRWAANQTEKRGR